MAGAPGGEHHLDDEPGQWYHDAIIAAGAIAYLALIVQMLLPTRRSPHS